MKANVRNLSDYDYLHNLNRLAADKHLDLHMTVLGMVDEFGVDALHLGPHIDAYITNIETERIEMLKKAPGKIARYMTARYSTDRQCERMVHVVCMFSIYMPSKALDAFVIKLSDFLRERFNKR